MEGLGGKRKLALPHGSIPHHPDTAVLLMGQVKALVREQRYPTERALRDQRGSARICPNKKQQQHCLITSARKKAPNIMCVLIWMPSLFRNSILGSCSHCNYKRFQTCQSMVIPVQCYPVRAEAALQGFTKGK